MNTLLTGEHRTIDLNAPLSLQMRPQSRFFPNREEDAPPCYSLTHIGDQWQIETHYFVGIDWVEPLHIPLCVQPKLNIESSDPTVRTIEVDYNKMLLQAIALKETQRELPNLLWIRWNQPPIPIRADQDTLTPFLLVQFLGFLQNIVRKGLKKANYRVAQNLQNCVKGKVLMSQNIRTNAAKGDLLHVWCSFEEFGVNTLENRILKKAFVFARRYLEHYKGMAGYDAMKQMAAYIAPAFDGVSDLVALDAIKQFKVNDFYPMYTSALRLAQWVLRRFSYNLSLTSQRLSSTPPYWIDMSKLFELYALSLFKKRFGDAIVYHPKFGDSEPDFLLHSPDYQMVVDAKYKRIYEHGRETADMRQVSGYARLKRVYNHFDKPTTEGIDCLIAYPSVRSGYSDLLDVDLKKDVIQDYTRMYKIGLSLPLLKKN